MKKRGLRKRQTKGEQCRACAGQKPLSGHRGPGSVTKGKGNWFKSRVTAAGSLATKERGGLSLPKALRDSMREIIEFS